MNILFIPHWYPSEFSPGVSGTFCREHVMAVKSHVNITVLHVVTDISRRDFRRSTKEFDDEGVLTIQVSIGLSPIPKTSYFLRAHHFRRAMDMALERSGRPDVIHCQAGNAFLVSRYAARHDIPFVISQHWSKYSSRGKLSFGERQRAKYFFPKAAMVLPAQSGTERFFFATYGVPEDRVAWMPNTFDSEIFRTSSNSRDSVLLHASGFTKEKRIRDVIDAFKIVSSKRPEARLHLAGDGASRETLEAYAGDQLTEGSFKFHGFINKSELASWMRKAKGFVFPSEFETFGCALMEAMASGCPVITTHVGGIPSVVRDRNEGILVEVGDIQAIADGMLRCIDDTHGLPLAEIADTTKKRFSHESVGRLLLDVYERARSV
jgi:glycosyltransferase involved in cell wall biosynthesis